jgi:MoaA/NifB/PqqE/SkfB family radical SAM enzyme
LIEHTQEVGVRVSLAPSATPHRLKQPGLAWLAVSLDGSHAAVHDAFREMSGSFDRTMEAIEWANEAGLPVQINTTFSRCNIDDLERIATLIESKKIALWSVLFLVPTGRGKLDDLLSADEFEAILAKLYALSKQAGFHIKTTEALHYGRYILQQQVAARRNGAAEITDAPTKEQDTFGRAPRGA